MNMEWKWKFSWGKNHHFVIPNTVQVLALPISIQQILMLFSDLREVSLSLGLILLNHDVNMLKNGSRGTHSFEYFYHMNSSSTEFWVWIDEASGPSWILGDLKFSFWKSLCLERQMLTLRMSLEFCFVLFSYFLGELLIRLIQPNIPLLKNQCGGFISTHS